MDEISLYQPFLMHPSTLRKSPCSLALGLLYIGVMLCINLLEQFPPISFFVTSYKFSIGSSYNKWHIQNALF